MKHIKLDYSREMTISDEAFAQITTIAMAHMVCSLCHRAYTNDNPNVALNLCLKCFLRKHENQSFSYEGLYETNERGEAIHWFLDPFDMIHYTNATSLEPAKSDYFTLLHWQFPVPNTYQDGEETKDISQYHWSIYGDQTTDKVLLIHNTLDYGSDKSVDFLTWRETGKTEQIDRQRGNGRRLFLQARRRIEATKSGSTYHIDGSSFRKMEDYWLRKIVAVIVNEEDDQTQQQ